MQKDITYIKQSIDKNEEQHKEIMDYMKELKKNFDCRIDFVEEKGEEAIKGLNKIFASKLSEKIVYGLIGTILTTIILLALNHLLTS